MPTNLRRVYGRKAPIYPLQGVFTRTSVAFLKGTLCSPSPKLMRFTASSSECCFLCGRCFPELVNTMKRARLFACFYRRSLGLTSRFSGAIHLVYLTNKAALLLR